MDALCLAIRFIFIPVTTQVTFKSNLHVSLLSDPLTWIIASFQQKLPDRSFSFGVFGRVLPPEVYFHLFLSNNIEQCERPSENLQDYSFLLHKLFRNSNLQHLVLLHSRCWKSSSQVEDLIVTSSDSSSDIGPTYHVRQFLNNWISSSTGTEHFNVFALRSKALSVLCLSTVHSMGMVFTTLDNLEKQKSNLMFDLSVAQIWEVKLVTPKTRAFQRFQRW